MKSASFKLGFKLPPRLKDEEITNLTILLRATGCRKSKEELIKSHMYLAASMAGRYIKMHPRREDDLISAALLGLTQAVTWAPARMHDNNITPYIRTTVQRFIRDYLQTDALVAIERREFKRRLENGNIHEVLPYFYFMPSEDKDEENPRDSEYADVTPEVFDDPVQEYSEMVQFIHKDNDDLQFILQGLLEGNTYEEIADELGVTKQRICQQVAVLRERVRLWEAQYG